VLTLVLSAAGAALETLTAALSDAGVDEGWVIRNSAAESVIRSSAPDFITAVLNPAPVLLDTEFTGPGASLFTNLDVAARAGRAVGQGYPVLLVVPPPLPRPADLMGAVVAPCALDDFEVMRLHVWAFVSTLSGRVHLASPESVAPPVGFDATSVLSQLYQIDSKQRSAASQVERLVASLLSQVGAELVENLDRDKPDGRVDLAFLPSRDTGDIVLAEVKAGQLTEKTLSIAEEQLQRYVAERHASLGLLLYHDFDGRRLPGRRTTPPVTVRMSVRELITGLATNSLPQLLSSVARDATRWFI
jgi:hypothetical protein